MSFGPDEHHWSGWPGAYCMKCQAEDPREIALADGLMDAHGNFAPAVQAEIDTKMICPVKGVLVYNETTNKWDLHKEASQ